MTAMSKKEVGATGEKVATQFITRKGFCVLEMNYRKPWGEIDIIAIKGNSVRFVEVKTVVINDDKNSNERHSPEEMLTAFKLKKVSRTAQLYMQEKHDMRDYQIDAVTILLNTITKTAKCTLYEQVL